MSDEVKPIAIGWPDGENPEIVSSAKEGDDLHGGKWFVPKSAYDALEAENEEIMETLEEVHKANKILEAENERLIVMCEKMAEALRFYAERKHLEYLRLHGEEYVKEIGGKRAREALAEYEKLKGEK